MNRGNRGFTLIEVLVSAALAGIGILAVLQALGGISHSEALQRSREHLMVLATRKYQEVVATQDLQTSSLSGDFQDWSDPDYKWQATVAATGTTNLSSVTLTVTRTTDSSKYVQTGLVYLVGAQSTSATPTVGGG